MLATHLAAGVVALPLVPHGFGLTNVHLWSNTVVPASCVLAAVVAFVALLFRRSPAPASALVSAAAGGWTAAVATGAYLFPISMPLARCAAPAAVAIALLGLSWWARERTAVTIAALVLGMPLGALEVFAQRAPPPSTRPAGGALAEVHGEAASDEAANGQVLVPCGKNKLRINPLLTFQSRSPDATWVILAPKADLEKRRALTHYTKTPNGFRASYTDDGETTLLATREKSGALDIEAVTKLTEPVYAHLDTWTTIHLPFEATISFSPTGTTTRFPIEPADYPAGRPSQLAYLSDDLSFHVVRARDAEKGPFTELAKGRLTRDETLAIEIRPRDEKDKGCRLSFKDWAAQVSTDESPTAGWGVPQGSIQFFSRDGESVVLLTLAETGPGRGFDSVGHAAGTYRNRLRIEPIR
ncbi:MAG: hypothetical protein JWP87_6518 [Labilithrix sp.]|nr:hypothetical protein [Labilithrix sp.]